MVRTPSHLPRLYQPALATRLSTRSGDHIVFAKMVSVPKYPMSEKALAALGSDAAMSFPIRATGKKQVFLASAKRGETSLVGVVEQLQR